MQVTKRTFLKGLLATAAAGGVVSQASAKPQADLPAKWDREAAVSYTHLTLPTKA